VEEISELTEAEQKDLFGEPIIAKPSKQISHRNSNVRRERFVRHFLLCGNATEAAMRAGYAADTPAKERYERCKHYGSWLLRQPDVIECLEYYKNEIKGKDLIQLEDIIDAAWETYHDPRLAPSRREPLLSLLSRLGGHFTDKMQFEGNLLSVRDLLAAREAGSSHFSTPVEGAGKTGGQAAVLEHSEAGQSL